MTVGAKVPELAERLIRGDRSAVARALTLVENGEEPFGAILEAIFPHTGSAFRLGVTGPPGSGKSTLVGGLARMLRAEGITVGVIAVDPTSPFSGGALLGDRLRMMSQGGDDGLYIRSMASRGSPGGLAAATADAVDVLDAYGVQFVIVETVGAGQTEVDIVSLADTVCLVLTPESGDAVQAMKAGLMEIADVYVVNKSDRSGASRLAQQIKSSRAAGSKEGVAIVRTVATREKGLQDLRAAIEAHRTEQSKTGGWERRRKEAVRRRIASIVERKMHREIWLGERRKSLDEETEKVFRKEDSPLRAAERLLRGAGKGA